VQTKHKLYIPWLKFIYNFNEDILETKHELSLTSQLRVSCFSKHPALSTSLRDFEENKIFVTVT